MGNCIRKQALDATLPSLPPSASSEDSIFTVVMLKGRLRLVHNLDKFKDEDFKL
jgi:hypothetical protein